MQPSTLWLTLGQAGSNPSSAPAAGWCPARPGRWGQGHRVMRAGGAGALGCPRSPDPAVLGGGGGAGLTHSAITRRTLLAYRAGSFFSSSEGVYTGRNCAYREGGHWHEHGLPPLPTPPQHDLHPDRARAGRVASTGIVWSCHSCSSRCLCVHTDRHTNPHTCAHSQTALPQQEHHSLDKGVRAWSGNYTWGLSL